MPRFRHHYMSDDDSDDDYEDTEQISTHKPPEQISTHKPPEQLTDDEKEREIEKYMAKYNEGYEKRLKEYINSIDYILKNTKNKIKEKKRAEDREQNLYSYNDEIRKAREKFMHGKYDRRQMVEEYLTKPVTNANRKVNFVDRSVTPHNIYKPRDQHPTRSEKYKSTRIPASGIKSGTIYDIDITEPDEIYTKWAGKKITRQRNQKIIKNYKKSRNYKKSKNYKKTKKSKK